MFILFAVLLTATAVFAGFGPLAMGLTGGGSPSSSYLLVRASPFLCGAATLAVLIVAARGWAAAGWLRRSGLAVLGLVALLSYPLPRWGPGLFLGLYPLDDPMVATADAVELEPEELVYGVFVEGEARAYPLRYLISHEIVNDQLGDTPLVATY